MVRGDLPARPLGVTIRVLGARSTPKLLHLAEGSAIVGAAPESDLSVADPSVSRAHVELGLVPEGVSVRDLKSRNGTFYLGQRVQSMTLTPGARLQLGNVTVAIDLAVDELTGGELYGEPSYRGLLGESTAMRRLFTALTRLEGSLVPVLVTGESGVGKELVARALHDGSQVASGPLVVVNCGAIPRELVASELFGHKRGAFTGASEARVGAFQSANGGTLFLDEIGELPLDVQPVLLRALESGEVRVVGGDRTSEVRVRVVAATNRDLGAEVTAGRFREDLYYRLAVVTLEVPPLRDRIEDIDALAQRFAASAGVSMLPPMVLERLRSRTWAGNVRQLRNVVQSFAALGVLPPERDQAGSMEDPFPRLVDVDRSYADQKDELVDRFTKAYLEALMAKTGGNQSAAARLSGLDRSWLIRLLVKHGLVRDP
jgi:DNA-binding NtrC family response regulator